MGSAAQTATRAGGSWPRALPSRAALPPLLASAPPAGTRGEREQEAPAPGAPASAAGARRRVRRSRRSCPRRPTRRPRRPTRRRRGKRLSSSSSIKIRVNKISSVTTRARREMTRRFPCACN